MRRSSHSASGLRLVGAVQRALVGDLPDHRHERVVLQVAPDARQLVAHLHAGGAQLLAPAPMPDSSSSCGELIAPADSSTSRSARTSSSPRRPRAQAHADRALALELDAEHASPSCAPRGSGRVERRAQEGVGGAEALAVLAA